MNVPKHRIRDKEDIINIELIIYIFDKWYRMKTDMDVSNSYPMTSVTRVPLRLRSQCDVIYDLTQQVMIKNRYGDTKLNDAIAMRIWLDEELALFEYDPEKFDLLVFRYYDGLNKSEAQNIHSLL